MHARSFVYMWSSISLGTLGTLHNAAMARHAVKKTQTKARLSNSPPNGIGCSVGAALNGSSKARTCTRILRLPKATNCEVSGDDELHVWAGKSCVRLSKRGMTDQLKTSVLNRWHRLHRLCHGPYKFWATIHHSTGYHRPRRRRIPHTRGIYHSIPNLPRHVRQ